MSYIADTIGPEGFGAYEVDWSRDPPGLTRVHRAPEVLLTPGFVDLHIHGGFGIDFMEADRVGMEVLCKKLRERGYEGFLPTTVAASAADVARALDSLPEDPMILGFHLEGPFLSPSYPGAQPPEAIVLPPSGSSEWDPILDDPRLKVATLAPELPGTLELTSRLAQRGVRVSMGHTAATYDEARFGFEFGASSVTHTFNAMRPFHHREAGVVGYALANPDLDCELIYDRRHVVREAAALLIRSKPDRVIAVSDSSKATGLPRNQYLTMWGVEVETGDGAVYLKGTRTFAGSAITLLDAFRNLAEDFGPETAIRCCSLHPRRALGITEKPKVYVEFDRKLDLVGVRAAS